MTQLKSRLVQGEVWAPVVEPFDVITGTNGDDILSDTAGNDTINGLDGNDRMTVTAGIDTVNGGSGNDRLIIDYSASTGNVVNAGGPAVNGGLGGFNGSFTNSFDRSVGYDSIEHFTITSGGTADNITTATGNDIVSTGGGNDVVNVGSGTDQADGGDGEDGISADQATATAAILWNLQANSYSGGIALSSFANFEYFGTITTGSGNDVVVTRNIARNETINLGDGNDSAAVLHGLDTVNGGLGDDRLIIDYSASTGNVVNASGPAVNGGLGGFNGSFTNSFDRSVSYDSIEHFTITSGGTADNITTATGNDIVSTGSGNDVVNVGSGTDQGDGGDGEDGISANQAAATAAILWNLQANSYSGGIALSNFVNFEYFGTITTGSGDDVVVTRNIARGETINLGDGNDSATVLHGLDTVNGGLGDDRLIIDYSASDGNVVNGSGPAVNGGLGGFNGSFTNSFDRNVTYDSIEHFTITSGGGIDNITTATGNDVVNTGSGNDLINVGSGTDQADGGADEDGISANMAAATGAILWNLQANTYSGATGTNFTNFEHFGAVSTGSGDDVLVTRNIARNETIDLGGGNDSATVLHGNDTVNGGSGSDRLIIDYSASDGNVGNSGGPAVNGGLGGFNGAFTNAFDRSVSYDSIEHFTITAGAGLDNITTATGNDIVSTGGGNDVVNVGSGTDQADGGAGQDGISADMATATGAILWNLQANSYSGATGTNFTNFEYFGTVSTGGGNDVVVTRNIARNETINLGGGNDSATVLHGLDTVNGGLGNDRLIMDYRASGGGIVNAGGPAVNGLGGFNGAFTNSFDRSVTYDSIEHFTIFTGTGNTADNITTAGGDDVVYHFGLNSTTYLQDTINLGAGSNDLMVGDFTAVIDFAVTTAPEPGFDLGFFVGGNGKTRILNAERMHLIGGAQGDTFTGLVGNDILEGRAGNDTLNGGVAGNDILNGGLGADTMTGGVGDDTYHVNEAGDQVIEASNEGADTVLSSALTYTLGANLENLASTLPERPYVVSAETQINTDIVAATQHPRGVTVLNDGGYVVTWQDVNNGTDVRARVYNADGTARSAEFTVHASTAGNQGQFGIGSVALANGGFLVAYYETLAGPNDERIAGRVFDASGVAQGASYTLTDTAGTFDSFPALARLNNGQIALLSQNGGAQDGNGTFGIRYQLLNADGSVGAAAPVVFQTTTAGEQIGPAVARLDDGRLIVVWESGEPGGKVFRGRYIDANGAPSGNDFVLSSPGGESPDSGEVRAQVTAINGGGFAVVWGITNEIVGRVFDSAGLPVGGEFTVNQRAAGAQTTVAVTRLAEGGFMAAWTSDQGEDGDAQSVVARLFNPDGSARGDDFVVNQIGTRFQLWPEMATLQDGRIVLVFSSDVPGSGSNYEGKQIILDTTPDQTLIGNELANQITGGFGNDTLNGADGNDILNGAAGNDSLLGGLGNDIYIVDDAGDTVTENLNEGTDEVRTTLASYTLTANVETLVGMATTGQALTGNGLANVITGNSGADTLDGGAGADSMTGGAGNDTYFVTDAGDAVTELAAEGTDEVRTSLTAYSLGANVENLTGLGTGGQLLTGNGLANVITGNSGADTLDGGAGADAMTGGLGNDTYIVDDAGDTVTENVGEGTDEVRTGLAAYSLGANVENLTGLGTGGQLLTGNGLVNVIDGGGGADVLDGGAAADTLIGGDGDDVFIVDDAGDQIVETATAGAGSADQVRTALATYSIAALTNVESLLGLSNSGQTLTGNGGANLIYGASGNDVIDGNGGADTLVGGLGDDVYLVNAAGVTVVENASEGTDEVRTGLASYALAAANVENLTGTSNAGQTLTGNSGANIITGASGNDTLDGNGGTDTLVGGLGNDVYFIDSLDDVVAEAASAGTDEIRTALGTYSITGLANVENLTGSTGAQTLTGNAGANVIDGGAGADAMTGGAGNDVYLVDDAGDTVVENAGEGTDEIRTALATYSIATLANVENLTGAAGAQSLTGNAGGNVIDGGAGADVMTGGLGNDFYVVDDAGDVVTENAGEGTDEVRTALASYSIEGLANVENLTGTSNAGQTLLGNAGINAITGAAGADRLDGRGGADSLAGQGGDDVYVVYGGEQIFELGGGGADYVLTYGNYALTAGAEVETLSTANHGALDPIQLTGNALANTLIGNAGANRLDGGGGMDVLAGLAGDDTYLIQSGQERIFESVGAGADYILSYVSYALEFGAEVETLSTANHGATDAIDLTGNEIANTLLGNNGVNTLRGGGGADVMAAFGGDDFYVVYSAASRVVETAGGGSDYILSYTSFALESGSAVEVISTADHNAVVAIDLSGNELANDLIGNGGANVLNGGAGADRMVGLGGADTFSFTSTLGASNVDQILDMTVGIDKIALDDAVFAGLALGALAAGAFNTGPTAQDADDRILYDAGTGALYFDADGAGGAAAVQFATLSTGLAMTANEFTVI